MVQYLTPSQPMAVKKTGKAFLPHFFFYILNANLSSFYCDIIHIDKSRLSRYDMQGADLRAFRRVLPLNFTTPFD
jgi:hypothetical protein